QQGGLIRGEWIALRRHALAFVLAENTLEEPAVGALAGEDDWPGVAALERECFRVQPQAALLTIRAVTGETARFQDGPHVAREVDGSRRGAACLGATRQRDQDKESGAGKPHE